MEDCGIVLGEGKGEVFSEGNIDYKQRNNVVQSAMFVFPTQIIS